MLGKIDKFAAIKDGNANPNTYNKQTNSKPSIVDLDSKMLAL